MKRFLRFTLLTIYHCNIATLIVTLIRGPRAAAGYLKRLQFASKVYAGAYVDTVQIDQLLKGREASFCIYHPDDETWSLRLTQISTLCAIVAARQPKKILEIGTFRGLTTLNLAMNSPAAEVHTVDITDKWGSYYYTDRPEAARIHQHYGDTNTFDFAALGPGFNFCLIDGGHSYQQVKNDTRRVLPILSDDCLLTWDDYGHNDFLPDGEYYGVSRFIHEIKGVGVQLISGTNTAILELTPKKKSQLRALIE